MTPPLAGIRVVDLCVEIGGSMSGMLLADYGADVVRPESTTGGHRRPSPRQDPGAVCWDRGKRHVTLRSLHPTTDPELAELLSSADIVLLDGGPRAIAEAGWDLAALEEKDPHLVIGWLPTMGARGPLADLSPDPLLLSAISGYSQQQSSVNPVPIAPVVPIINYVHGILGAGAVVAAVLERRRSGRGQIVTVTGLHGVSALAAAVMPHTLEQANTFVPSRNIR